MWISTQHDPTNQLSRWVLTLQEHNFNIQYQPGLHHANANAMTHGPINNGEAHVEQPGLVAAVMRGLKNPSGCTRYSHDEGVVRWSSQQSARSTNGAAQPSRELTTPLTTDAAPSSPTSAAPPPQEDQSTLQGEALIREEDPDLLVLAK